MQGNVLGISSQANQIMNNFNIAENNWQILLIVLDIFIVTLVFYWIYILIRETRGIRILYGIILLILITVIGRYLHLAAFNFVLKYLSTMILVAIPIVFQPELRGALEKLGRAKIVTDIAKLKRRDIQNLSQMIVEATQILSKNNIGALIVIGRQTGLREYIETGTLIDGQVSTELLLTIFTNKTPLHDGAIIITGNKIAAAGCTLPLTDSKMNLSLGTRHRAALGMAMHSDALIIVVSEENGDISFAKENKLYQHISADELLTRLSTELNELRSAEKER